MRRTLFNHLIIMLALLTPVNRLYGETSLKYFKYTFHYSQGDTLVLKDYNGDGLKDVIIVSKRQLKFFPQKTGDEFDSSPGFTLFLPMPYTHYDFRKGGPGKKHDLALLSPRGIEIFSLNGDSFTSPPVTVLEKHLSLLPEPDSIHDADFFKDIDGDGKDDLLIPEGDGFCIYLADDFSSPCLRIPINNNINSMFREFPSLTPYTIELQSGITRGMTPLTIHDPGHPGRTRLSSQEKSYVLGKDRRFMLETSPSSDSFRELEEEREDVDRSILAWKRLDFNKDGKPDKVLFQTQENPLAFKTVVKIFLSGSQKTQPDFQLRSRGISPYWYDCPFQEVNGDDYPDLILLNLDYQGASLESNLRAFLQKGMTGTLDFYLWDKARGLPSRASFSFPIRLQHQLFNFMIPDREFFHTGEDFTGDGNPDLLVKTGSKEYSVYPFIDTKTGFSTKPFYRFQLPLPPNEFEILDINNDKQADVLFSCSENGGEKIFLDVLFLSHAN